MLTTSQVKHVLMHDVVMAKRIVWEVKSMFFGRLQFLHILMGKLGLSF